MSRILRASRKAIATILYGERTHKFVFARMPGHTKEVKGRIPDLYYQSGLEWYAEAIGATPMGESDFMLNVCGAPYEGLAPGSYWRTDPVIVFMRVPVLFRRLPTWEEMRTWSGEGYPGLSKEEIDNFIPNLDDQVEEEEQQR